jgi:hypothetical protein
MTYFFENVEFWSSFLSGLIATMIGVATGIPIALWLDRKIAARHRKEDAIRVLAALKDEITHNIALLKQMRGELPSAVIFYNLNLSTWEATSASRLEAVENYELVRHISRIYYEFQHLSRKVDVQFHMHYSALLAMNNYDKIRASIVVPIIAHAATLEKESESLLAEIDEELSRLSNKS